MRPSKVKWYTLTAKAQCVYNKAQDHDMVALMQMDATVADKPKEQYVTFN